MAGRRARVAAERGARHADGTGGGRVLRRPAVSVAGRGVSAPVVGIDLRPANVAVAPLVESRLGESQVQATASSDPFALVDQIVAMVQGAEGEEPAAVGVSIPRIVEFETGRVVSTSRPVAAGGKEGIDLPLADVPLREVLEVRLGVPVFVDNDANVAGLAEAHDENLALVTRHLVMFTVGTHVGGGLVLDGLIYRGATGAAGELGQTMLGLDLAGAVPAP